MKEEHCRHHRISTNPAQANQEDVHGGGTRGIKRPRTLSIRGQQGGHSERYVETVTSVTNVRLVPSATRPVTCQHPSAGNTSAEGWNPVRP